MVLTSIKIIKVHSLMMMNLSLAKPIATASQVGAAVKNPPANARDIVLIPVRKMPLEKERATHSSILAWRIPWTEEPGRLQSIESQRVRHD